MPEPTRIEFQNDHKHWLQELERWEGYLRTYTAEHRNLVDDFRRFLESLEQHGRELESQAAALSRHQQEIIACERAMVEQSGPGEAFDAQLRTCHAQCAEHHEELRRVQERLQQHQHAFLAQVAMCRHATKTD